ncbi:hypothetical protein SprV_0602064600 [Sparganum proliferum]
MRTLTASNTQSAVADHSAGRPAPSGIPAAHFVVVVVVFENPDKVFVMDQGVWWYAQVWVSPWQASASSPTSGHPNLVMTSGPGGGGGGECAVDAAQVYSHYKLIPAQVTVPALTLLDRRRAIQPQSPTPKMRFVKAANTVRTMLRADRTAKVVNPEISRKVKEAESQAVAQYLKKMQFEKIAEAETASLKAYARPTSSISTKPPARRRLSNISHISNLLEEDEGTVPGDFRDMQAKLLGNLQTHDDAIAAERQKLQDILNQRRSAAKTARTAHALSRANQLLTRQSGVEQGLEQAKADLEEKLKTRILLQKHIGGSKSDAKTSNYEHVKTLDTVA